MISLVRVVVGSCYYVMIKYSWQTVIGDLFIDIMITSKFESFTLYNKCSIMKYGGHLFINKQFEQETGVVIWLYLPVMLSSLMGAPCTDADIGLEIK